MLRRARIIVPAVAAVALSAGLLLAPRQPVIRAAQIAGELDVTGIRANVRIIRDSQGVPHIYASSSEDAWFGLGFVHSQDRRLQMELTRAFLRGRLSELTGSNSLPSDRVARTVGYLQLAEAEAAMLSPEHRAFHEAYARGVNEAARLADWRSGAIPKYLNVPDEPWTVVDSLLVLKLDALSISEYSAELLTSALASQLSEEDFRWLVGAAFGEADPGIVRSGPERKDRRPAPNPRRRRMERPASPLGALDYPGLFRLAQAARPLPVGAGIGSNSWVISGPGSSTGAPILASDPHMPLSAPSGIYAAHLSAPDLEVIGVGIPGLPAFHHGHNRRIAWAVTVAGTDSQDLFVEQLRENTVRTPAGWEPLHVRTEEIRVKDSQDPVKITVRVSRHGPILSDANPALLQGIGNVDSGYGLAVSSALLKASQPGWYFQLAAASDWTGFREALRQYSGPGYNFLYGDVEGNIGYQLAARVPVREGGVSATPVAGWESGHEWRGEVPFDELPSMLNPAESSIATANSKIVDTSYPYYLATRWADLPWRALRIRELLASQSKFSVEETARMQMDVYQGSMAPIVRWAMLAGDASDEIRGFQEALGKWDRQARTDSVEQSMAEMFRLALSKEVFRTRLNAQLLDPYILSTLFPATALERIMDDPNAAFFGADATQARQRRADTVTNSIRIALEALKARFGADRAKWAWGQTHTLVFASLFAGGSADTSSWSGQNMNVGPFGIPGSSTTIDNSWWRPTEPFRATNGPGYRQVIDLGDFSRSLYTPPPPGQSENPESKYYRDLVENWIRGDQYPMRWSEQQVSSDAAETLVLRPAQ